MSIDIVEGAQRDVQRDLLAGGFSGYGAIYADPPWRFETRSARGRSRSPDSDQRMVGRYDTMTTDDICAMPIGERAGKHCALLMWAVCSMLPDALRVGASWGFTYKTCGVWAKTRVSGFDPGLTLEQNFPMGTGYILRGNPELLLVFTRGQPAIKSHSIRGLVIEPRREHSRKPDSVRRSIERLVDGPYLELFARTAAPGWDCFGNQVGTFQEQT